MIDISSKVKAVICILIVTFSVCVVNTVFISYKQITESGHPTMEEVVETNGLNGFSKHTVATWERVRCDEPGSPYYRGNTWNLDVYDDIAGTHCRYIVVFWSSSVVIKELSKVRIEEDPHD